MDATTETITTTDTWRAKGFTEDITTCEHCGRTDLKGTVRMVLVDADGGEADDTFMGTTCAARMTGRKVKDITTEARRADKARTDAIRAAHSTWSNARSSVFCDARDAALGKGARFAAISAWSSSPEGVALMAAWDAANPEPERPWSRLQG